MFANCGTFERRMAGLRDLLIEKFDQSSQLIRVTAALASDIRRHVGWCRFFARGVIQSGRESLTCQRSGALLGPVIFERQISKVLQGGLNARTVLTRKIGLDMAFAEPALKRSGFAP
jgi:hypothetical protein